MTQPSFIVLCGDGINCERETAHAFQHAGAQARIVHVNDLLDNPSMLAAVEGLALPGGFSFGDELGSGQIMALKMRYGLGDAFFKFVAADKPVIGICNGFQVLVKLGLLPFPRTLDRAMALAPNIQGGFINRWAAVDVPAASVCKWTQGIASMELPVRHGEGRVVFAEAKTCDALRDRGQIALVYREDINGSHERIAGICDETGLVLGLMPHPEAHLYRATYRRPSGDTMAAGDGAAVFNNIVSYIKGEEPAHDRRHG